MEGIKNMSAFIKAIPVWLKNRRHDANLQVGFRCDFLAPKNQKYTLRLCGSTLYRIFLNGEFVGYGPARAGHGYMRIDTISLDVRAGENKLAIEVAGYNCACFYTLNIPSFLCAEVVLDGDVIAYTGRDFSALPLDSLRKRVVFRYSFQRPYTEVWDYTDKALSDWKTSDTLTFFPVKAFQIAERFIERTTAYPKYEIRKASEIAKSGITEKEPFDKNYYLDRRIKGISNTFCGFYPDDIRERPVEEISCTYKPTKFCRAAAPFTLNYGNYVIYRLTCNSTGFIRAKFKVKEKATVYLTYSEVLRGEHLYRDSQVSNIIKLTYLPGEYEFESFEAYTFQYICAQVTEGEVEIGEVGVREYCYPHCENIKFSSDDENLNKIFAAAIETFRQNTLDVFMDCPSRERAGWLCDSFFTAQSEQYFVGNSDVETAFIDNFVMAEEFPSAPEGILPMCYPADILDGNHIPQWNMWLMIELEQFFKRTRADKEKYRKICYDFLGYIMQFRNADGLLEKVPGWNFVEWSMANKWVQDVNYPSNMLFSKCCRVIGEIYGDDELIAYSKTLREKIIEQSFNGEFFIDNAIRRDNGRLELTSNISEAGQYYAFFTGVADRDDPRFAEYYKTVLYNLGPDMDREKYKIEPAKPFIGNYLRMELLLRWQKYDEILDQIKKFFTKMADITGTLWEHDADWASTCHGFASFAAVAITRAICGIKWIDNMDKILYVDKCHAKNYNGVFDLKCGITVTVKNGERSIENRGEWKIIEK